MDNIKEAFQKVKQDIISIKKEIEDLKQNISYNREKMVEICEIITILHEKIDKSSSTQKTQIPTISTSSSTHQQPLEALKPQDLPISTGNGGVSTDRQTDRQTDTYAKKQIKNGQNILKNTTIEANSFENAVEILDSLDGSKKEIRLKFKKLTEQEVLIFSTIYQIEEETGYANYRLISEKLNLTESSVRDYVGRLIRKGIPIDKKKVNNKQVQLFISQNLKKIAPLSTILQLRDL